MSPLVLLTGLSIYLTIGAAVAFVTDLLLMSYLKNAEADPDYADRETLDVIDAAVARYGLNGFRMHIFGMVALGWGYLLFDWLIEILAESAK